MKPVHCLRHFPVMLLVIFLLSTALNGYAQDETYWTPVKEASVSKDLFAGKFKPKVYKLFQLDHNLLKTKLKNPPSQKNVSLKNSTLVISMPNAEGVLEKYKIVEISDMEPGLEAKYPDIKTYRGQGIDDPSSTIGFVSSPFGFHAMIFSSKKQTTYIEPIVGNDSRKNNYYTVFSKEDAADNKIPFTCGTDENSIQSSRLLNRTTNADDNVLRTYRLALACTGEYAQDCYLSETDVFLQKSLVLVAMVTLVDGLNLIYERDFSIHLKLAFNNNDIIFTDPATDFWEDDMSPDERRDKTAEVIDLIIKDHNYDIGHLLVKAKTYEKSGYSKVGCVCQTYIKGLGYSSHPNPVTDPTFVEVPFAHEIGHQFGARHTYSFRADQAPPVINVLIEPGSGSTIMSYAGSAGSAYNVKEINDSYFHAVNIEQVMNHIRGTGLGNCAQPTFITNTTPSFEGIEPGAGPDRTIPKSTPFVLKGSASDANDPQEQLTYTWEEMDIATTSDHSIPNVNWEDGPLFRSRPPSHDPSRTFPILDSILDKSNHSKWEILPTLNRVLNFRFTVRDNHNGGGANNSDDMIVEIDPTSGPFKVTGLDDGAIFAAGSKQTITWDVANTYPTRCTQVKISLSIDGGKTFSSVLKDATLNDGIEEVILPNITTQKARIKIESVGNIFFDISDKNFIIDNSYVAPKIWFKADAPILPPGTTTSMLPGINTVINGIDTTVANWFSEGQFLVGTNKYSLTNPPNFQIRPSLIRFQDKKRAVAFNGEILSGDLNEAPLVPGNTKTIMVVGQINCNGGISSPLLTFEDDGSGPTHTKTKMSLGISKRNNKTYAYTGYSSLITNGVEGTPINDTATIADINFEFGLRRYLAIYEIVEKGTDVSFRLNKVNVPILNNLSGMAFDLQANLHSFKMGGSGFVFEIVAFDGKLNTTDRDLWENYLVDKWNLHPSTPVIPSPPVLNITGGDVIGTNTTICEGQSVTVKVTGDLNAASDWVFRKGINCGDSYVTGQSLYFGAVDHGALVILKPSVTTTYFVRGEGKCDLTGPCTSFTITVKEKSKDPKPSVFGNYAALCEGQKDSLWITTPHIEVGAKWKWYTNLCCTAPSTFIAESDNIVIFGAASADGNKYFVRSEGPGCLIGEAFNLPLPVLQPKLYIKDFDHDGWSTGNPVSFCPNDVPVGYFEASLYSGQPGDCDDNDANINPGAIEIVGNGKDDNCDGWIDIISKNCQWNGSVSTNWHDPANWSCGSVPDQLSDVVIPTVVNKPVLSADGMAGKIFFNDPMMNIDLNGHTLTIYDRIYNVGIIKGAPSANLVFQNGIGGFLKMDQTIDGVTNTLNNLIINCQSNTDTVFLQNKLVILNSVNPIRGILTTANALCLRSTATKTASMGQGGSPGRYIVGEVTVERFVPANPFKTKRLLSVPTKGAQTIHQSWQEDAATPPPAPAFTNPHPGFGTNITAPSAFVANGFDYTSSDASILSFNAGNQDFQPLMSTLNPAQTKEGFFINVSGDRTITPSNSMTTQTATTLRTTGNLYLGQQLYGAFAVDQFSLLGNLYASAIDFTKLVRSPNIGNVFLVWDPKLANGSTQGAFQTFSAANNFECLLGGGSYTLGQPNTKIQSGQAFFVHSNSAGGTVTLNEDCKVSGSSDVFRPQGSAGLAMKMNISLYAVQGDNSSLIDAAAEVFDVAYSNAVDGDDAFKLAGFNENLAIERDGKKLAIESRQPVIEKDTIYLNMWNMQLKNYRFVVTTKNVNSSALTAFLLDGFLNTLTPVDLSAPATINFSITADPASALPNRFKIILGQAIALPISFISIGANTVNNGILVNWNVASEQGTAKYVIEHSADGITFTDAGTVNAKNNPAGTVLYNWLDKKPVSGNNYYRVKSVSLSGEVKYSGIAKVAGRINNPSYNLSPNPTDGTLVNLQLINQPKGRYLIRILNLSGQKFASLIIDHLGGNSSQALRLPATVNNGLYEVEISSPDNGITIKKLLVNRRN